LITSASKPLIAIVDDDESVCRALRRLVRSLGMSAESFSSGQEFIDVVEAMPLYEAACVVLDVRMQGLSGLEVQERLIHGGSHLPVIFITAHDDLKEREGALAAGAVAYLRKPFNDELFIKTLRVALSQSQ
jgi:FixJ family two-component response regulator